MNRLDSARMFNNFSKRVARVVASVHAFEAVTPTLARVIFTTNTNNGTPQELAHAIQRATENDVSPIQCSFREISSMSLPSYYGFVRLNVETRPYDPNLDSKLKKVGANLLVDASDESLWQVHKTDAGIDMLRRQNQQDMSTVLASVQVKVRNAPQLSSIVAGVLPAATNNGGKLDPSHQFAAFIDPDTESLRYGYILSSTYDKATSEQMVTILVNADLDDELEVQESGSTEEADFSHFHTHDAGPKVDANSWKMSVKKKFPNATFRQDSEGDTIAEAAGKRVGKWSTATEHYITSGTAKANTVPEAKTEDPTDKARGLQGKCKNSTNNPKADMRDGKNAVLEQDVVQTEIATVSAKLIVEIAGLKEADLDMFGAERITASLPIQYNGEGKDNIQRMYDYYKTLYGYAPEYYSKGIKPQIDYRAKV